MKQHMEELEHRLGDVSRFKGRLSMDGITVKTVDGKSVLDYDKSKFSEEKGANPTERILTSKEDPNKRYVIVQSKDGGLVTIEHQVKKEGKWVKEGVSEFRRAIEITQGSKDGKVKE